MKRLEIYAWPDGVIAIDRPLIDGPWLRRDGALFLTRNGDRALVGIYRGSYPRQMAEHITEWLPHAHVQIQSVRVSEKEHP